MLRCSRVPATRRSSDSVSNPAPLMCSFGETETGAHGVSYLGLDAASVFFLKLRSLKSEVGFRLWRDGGVRLACFCRKVEGGFRPWPDGGECLTCFCRKVEGGFRLGRGARQTCSSTTDETQ